MPKNISLDSGFTDAKIQIRPTSPEGNNMDGLESFINVHMVILNQIEYFRMIIDRSNFSNLPPNKCIFNFPDYSPNVIEFVVQLIYHEKIKQGIDNIDNYQAIYRLIDYIGIKSDTYVQEYMKKEGFRLEIEWYLYEQNARNDIKLLLREKEKELNIISVSTCAQICMLHDIEFIVEINKLIYLELNENIDGIKQIICLILSARIILNINNIDIYHIYDMIISSLLRNNWECIDIPSIIGPSYLHINMMIQLPNKTKEKTKLCKILKVILESNHDWDYLINTWVAYITNDYNENKDENPKKDSSSSDHSDDESEDIAMYKPRTVPIKKSPTPVPTKKAKASPKSKKY
jgi:hypothetical protein